MTNRIVLNEISYHGTGAIQEITDKTKARRFKRVLVCPNPDLIKFNITCRATRVPENAGLAYEVYSDIRPNPTIENTQTGVAAFKVSGTDRTIAVGGDSSIDTSETIGVITTNLEFEDVRGLEGVVPAKNPCVPIITVPTMAGTATGVTVDYVIVDVGKKRKFVCMDIHDIPAMAVVNPEMMPSMPKGLIAATGMGALTHAIKGHTTKGTRKVADMSNLKAIEVIAYSLRGTVENKPEGREGMILSQYLTRMGPSNCGLGIVHSMVHGLSTLYDTPHGVANVIILPAVTGYNVPYTGAKFKDTATAMDVEGVENVTQKEYRKAAADAVERLFVDVGVPVDLKEIVKPEDVDFLSQSAMDGACRPGNLEDPSFKDIKNLCLPLMQLHR